ncbi:MAG: DUF3352 domain-containing protein [Solirubrobacterales bacterium]|nr:DUF3352 domain-containing protein [Solirubrobacterales bacterium]
MRRLRTRSSRLVGLLSLAAIVATGGCGDSSSDDLASLAPPDAPLYAEVTLRPDGDQAEAISSLADRVAGIEDPGAAIVAELDKALAHSDAELDYADDVEPWLGDRASVFVRSFEPSEVADDVPDFAAAIEVDDVDAARSFLDRAAESDPDREEERSYEGFDYVVGGDQGIAAGIVDDHLVVGTERSLKVAVDASQGESLAESEEFEDRIAALGGDPLAMVFLEPGEVIDATVAEQRTGPGNARFLRPVLAGPLSGPVAIGLSATRSAASLDVAALYDGSGQQASGSTLLEGLPAGSWFAAALPDLGEPLTRLLEQLDNSGLPGAASFRRQFRAMTGLHLRRDLLDWLGDAAIFAQGTSAPGFRAGLIAETDDPDAPRALLERVQRFVERDSGLRSASAPEGADYGFQIGIPSLGGGAEAGVIGGRLVAVLGGTIEQVLDPPATLADDQSYRAARDALGDDLSPALYARLPTLLEVVEQDEPGPGYEAAAPYLEAFDSLIVGSRLDDGLVLARLVVTLAQ